jgi:hypothetical protein
MNTTQHQACPDSSRLPLWPSRPVTAPLFAFKFQRRYEGLYTNRHEKFVLRDEHIAELKRLVIEHNKDHAARVGALSMSDVINASLDFTLEHPLAFRYITQTQDLRESLSREVYRRAFLHFMHHEML